MKSTLLSGFHTVSKPSEVFTSFRGPLNQFRVMQSIDHEQGISRFWTVFSQGKRSTLVKYLWGKLLWDELNKLERDLFFHLSEITEDISIYLSLKALVLGVHKRDLRKRLEQGSFLGLQFITRQQYLSIKGRVNFFLLTEVVHLRKVTKYSGYTKHYKDKGTLRPERVENYSEIFELTSDISEEVILTYLTVGDISLFGGRVLHLDKSQERRNGPK
jgi:hypothetical protein